MDPIFGLYEGNSPQAGEFEVREPDMGTASQYRATRESKWVTLKIVNFSALEWKMAIFRIYYTYFI